MKLDSGRGFKYNIWTIMCTLNIIMIYKVYLVSKSWIKNTPNGHIQTAVSVAMKISKLIFGYNMPWHQVCFHSKLDVTVFGTSTSEASTMSFFSHFVLMDACQKLIASAEIPREPPYQIWVQSNQRFISSRSNNMFYHLRKGWVPKK